MNTATVRQPQIRYTYLAGNGLTIAGSVEQNESQILPATGGPILSDNFSAINNLPDLVGAVTLSQAWGDIGLHGAVHRNEIRTTTGISQKNTGFAVSAAGHLNTVGKDALRGGVTYIDGASTYISFASPSVIVNAAGDSEKQKAWAAWVGYTHFWASNLRSTVHGGYVHFDKPGNADAAQLPSLEKRWWAGHVNLIWSPVPQMDTGIEWVHWDRKVQSGAKGNDDRVDLQVKFYF
jgi:hypothetical protein